MNVSIYLLLLTLAVLYSSAEADTKELFGLTKTQIKNLIDNHNKWRKEAEGGDMFKLVWNDDLAADAMTWAKACVFEHGQPANPAFKKDTVGQNLGYSTRFASKTDASFKNWMEESDFYNFTTNECYWPPCGHYTQAMWHSHKKIGCAFHVCSSIYNGDGVAGDKRAKYLVCNYSPQGNVGGGRPWTPGKPCQGCPYCQDGLCVTRKVCMKAAENCVCKRKCQHCGTLTSDCRCICPEGTHGDECQHLCRDRKVECPYFPKSKCNDGSKLGRIVHDFCDVTCGRCKPNTDTSWTCADKKENFENTFARFARTPQYGYKADDGNRCAFPFRYQGKYHDKCIEEDGSTWCSRSTDFDLYRTKAVGCRTVKTTGGNAKGADCVFPFVHEKQYHHKCIFDKKTEKYWCGTTENFDADQKFGYCDPTDIA